MFHSLMEVMYNKVTKMGRDRSHDTLPQDCPSLLRLSQSLLPSQLMFLSEVKIFFINIINAAESTLSL